MGHTSRTRLNAGRWLLSLCIVLSLAGKFTVQSNDGIFFLFHRPSCNSIVKNFFASCCIVENYAQISTNVQKWLSTENNTFCLFQQFNSKFLTCQEILSEIQYMYVTVKFQKPCGCVKIVSQSLRVRRNDYLCPGKVHLQATVKMRIISPNSVLI